MRKILISAVAGAALAVVPAMAAKPTLQPDHPTPQHSGKAKGRCKTHNVGFNARGTLVSQSLTQTAGADTPTDPSDDRWSGDVVVNVTHANHKAPTGQQTYTLTDGKVSWYDANGDGTPDQPVAGDTVRIHGKITKQVKKCTGFSPTITVRSVSFQQAPPAPTAPTS